MEVKNCRDCGKLFNYISGMRICPECKQKLEDKFVEVKEFIRENPKASMTVISREMEVSNQQIYQWIREERLVFSEDSMVTIQCETCGASIRTGRYCDRCKNNVANGFEKLYKKEAPVMKKKEHDRDKMRFLDKE